LVWGWSWGGWFSGGVGKLNGRHDDPEMDLDGGLS